MTYVDANPVYALNAYVWKLLETNLGWTKKSYNGIVPIVPASQQPELLQTGQTFLVYGSAKTSAGHLYSLKGETVSYTVYGTSVAQINRVINLLTDVFDRQDEAAADINYWLENGRKKEDVSFASVKSGASQKADPADEEGGFLAGFVLLDVLYTKPEQNEDGTPKVVTRFSTP